MKFPMPPTATPPASAGAQANVPNTEPTLNDGQFFERRVPMGGSERSNHFSLEGCFLRFELEDGYKIKRLWLATANGEECIKLSKQARASCHEVLRSGDWLRVTGEQCQQGSGEWKRKAYHLAKITVPVADPSPVSSAAASCGATTVPQLTTPQLAPRVKTQTILVCQKSDCMKQGGRDICRALEQEIQARGLANQVAVRGTGCMKHCKSGPNLVIGKTRYSRINAREIPSLLEQHFSKTTVGAIE